MDEYLERINKAEQTWREANNNLKRCQDQTQRLAELAVHSGDPGDIRRAVTAAKTRQQAQLVADTARRLADATYS